MQVVTWQWLESYLRIEKNLGDSTIRGYKERFRSFMRFIKDTLTEETSDQYILELKRSFSVNTYHIHITLLRHIQHCFGVDFIKKYKYPRRDRKYIEILSVQEIKKLAETCTPRVRDFKKNNYRFKVAIYTLGTTGLRISELCNLKWVDVQNDRIVIQESKTGEMRVVPMMPHILKMIDKLERWPHEYVFGCHVGKMNLSNMNRELKARAKLAGINKNVHNHLFRHSFITECMRNNENPFKVAKIVGHRDVKTTLQYTHLVVEDLFNVVRNHPLAADKLNFDMIKLKVKGFMEGLHANNFKIEFEELNNEVLLRVIKNT